MAAKKTMSFEAALKRLDEITAQLDGGEAPLDDAMKLFAEGAELLAFCGEKLEKAKLTVEAVLPEKETETEKDTAHE